jgi:NAD(P)-dependent dehydrogenase (short-subunit alcohol dehydrogenase family)
LAGPLDLDGKLVLVTGASSGIGRVTARVLDELGATLVLSGRRADALEETRAALSTDAEHRIVSFDLTEVDAIDGWLKEDVVQGNRRLDGLVHSAGMGGVTPLRTQSRTSIERVMVPNLFAALGLMRGAASKRVFNDGASLVFVSSVAGIVGSAGLTAYSASKGGLEAAVRSAAVELRQRKLRVNAVAPGYVRTPLMDRSLSELPDVSAIETRQFLGILEPEEVAIAIAYLLSDSAKRITGTTLVIDGGYTC